MLASHFFKIHERQIFGASVKISLFYPSLPDFRIQGKILPFRILKAMLSCLLASNAPVDGSQAILLHPVLTRWWPVFVLSLEVNTISLVQSSEISQQCALQRVCMVSLHVNSHHGNSATHTFRCTFK